jgi:hypothetical protein
LELASSNFLGGETEEVGRSILRRNAANTFYEEYRGKPVTRERLELGDPQGEESEGEESLGEESEEGGSQGDMTGSEEEGSDEEVEGDSDQGSDEEQEFSDR